MMKLNTVIMTAITVACLGMSTAFADVYMTGKEVAALVVGNTIEGQYRECAVGRKDFSEFYGEDGTIRGRERECRMAGNWTTYGGSWKVEDGKFCVYLGSDRTSGCFDYQVDEDGTLRRFNEEGVTDLTFKIYDGNPDHL